MYSIKNKQYRVHKKARTMVPADALLITLLVALGCTRALRCAPWPARGAPPPPLSQHHCHRRCALCQLPSPLTCQGY